MDLYEKHAQTKTFYYFLLTGLECYKDNQMKAYNIIKLTAGLKSSDSVPYRRFWWMWLS